MNKNTTEVETERDETLRSEREKWTSSPDIHGKKKKAILVIIFKRKTLPNARNGRNSLVFDFIGGKGCIRITEKDTVLDGNNGNDMSTANLLRCFDLYHGIHPHPTVHLSL